MRKQGEITEMLSSFSHRHFESEATQDWVSPDGYMRNSELLVASMTGVLMTNSKQAAQREKMKLLNFDPGGRKS